MEVVVRGNVVRRVMVRGVGVSQVVECGIEIVEVGSYRGIMVEMLLTEDQKFRILKAVTPRVHILMAKIQEKTNVCVRLYV